MPHDFVFGLCASMSPRQEEWREKPSSRHLAYPLVQAVSAKPHRVAVGKSIDLVDDQNKPSYPARKIAPSKSARD